MSEYVLGLNRHLLKQLPPGKITRQALIPEFPQQRDDLHNLSAFFPLNVFNLDVFQYRRVRVDLCHVAINDNGLDMLVFEQVDFAGTGEDWVDIAAQQAAPALGRFIIINKIVDLSDYVESFVDELNVFETTVLHAAENLANLFIQTDENGEYLFDSDNFYQQQTWLPLNPENAAKTANNNQVLYLGAGESGSDLVLLFVKVWPAKANVSSTHNSFRAVNFMPLNEARAQCPLNAIHQDFITALQEDLLPAKQVFNVLEENVKDEKKEPEPVKSKSFLDELTQPVGPILMD